LNLFASAGKKRHAGVHLEGAPTYNVRHGGVPTEILEKQRTMGKRVRARAGAGRLSA
jgi:hypothetical protein